MKIHGNARLLPRQRALLCERVRLEGWTISDAAKSFGVSIRTGYRWLARWDAGKAMTDRSSAPKRRPTRTPAELEALVEQLRRARWTAPKIAAELRMPTSTVCAVLKRIGLNRVEGYTLAGLRDTLLPKLISGELRLKQAEDLAKAHL